MGIPGIVLAMLASRLRELDRRPPPPVMDTLQLWWKRGVRGVTRYVLPLAVWTGVGAFFAGLLALFQGIPSEVDTAVFGVCVSAGIAWTVWRPLPPAVRRATEAGQGPAGAPPRLPPPPAPPP